MLLLFVSVLPLLCSISPASATSTAYEVLQSHGLPKGLLPRGIQSFSIDGDGKFEAVLESPCTAKFESEVHYNYTVSGELSYGQIASLSGVSAQELFLWFPVLGVRVDVPSSGVIYFDVGVVYKRFALSLFENPPVCHPDASSSFPSSTGRDGVQRAIL